MRQTWRWFGPEDRVTISDMMQAGTQGIVSALHHIRYGEVWTGDEITKRQREIATVSDGTQSGLNWDVVESLPVSEDIKMQRGDYRAHFENYRTSLRNLAQADIKVVCYNFMPVLDWTRTDIAWPLPSGATCMRFDYIDFAAFDLFILERAGAAEDFPSEIVAQATERFSQMNDNAKQKLSGHILWGLPGEAEDDSLEGIQAKIALYDDINTDKLRAHFTNFLEEIIPAAQELGIRMCCHPDDPPFSLLGLPRIMSTETDFKWLIEAVDMPANGITLCAGSLGGRPDNDISGMMERLGHRVHFLHLRNVKRETSDVRGSFYESEHLGGDTNMAALVQAALNEEKKRRDAGRQDWEIPFRPDHGQDILDDLNRHAQPGYPAIGRLKGLAELRGLIAGLNYTGN